MLRRATQSLLGTAAAVVDYAASSAAYARGARARRANRAESLNHAERMSALGLLDARYREIGDRMEIRAPRAGLAPSWQRRRALPDGGEVCDLQWPSDHVTALPEVASRYAQGMENKNAAARVWLHPEPRPAAVLVHGYLAGGYSVEENIWPSSWLYRLGLDLAFFVLPFHGVRAIRGRRGAPPFPSSDPRVTNEGFRQAIGDLRDLTQWLHARGSAEIGVMGMSLGGYTTALAATAEPRLSFAVPIIPLASMADFARDQGRLGSTQEEAEREHGALDLVHRHVSPLHRKPLLSGDRMLVIAAKADRITPISHAERLAAHFGARLDTWHGGHLLQFGRAEKFRAVGRLLNRLGVIEDTRAE